MNNFINDYYYQIVLALLTGLFLLTILMLAGCGNLKDKGVVGEAKGLYLDASIPSALGFTTPSILGLKMVFGTVKFADAPNGKASISAEYNDINVWTLSGSGKSVMSVENYSDTNKGSK